MLAPVLLPHANCMEACGLGPRSAIDPRKPDRYEPTDRADPLACRYGAGVPSGAVAAAGAQVGKPGSVMPTESAVSIGSRVACAVACPESSTVPSALTTVNVQSQVQLSPVSSTVCGPRNTT